MTISTESSRTGLLQFNGYDHDDRVDPAVYSDISAGLYQRLSCKLVNRNSMSVLDVLIYL